MNPTRRGYPIGALFVLVTICAVLAAGISPLVQQLQQGQIATGDFLVAVGAGGLTGAFLGMILGLFQFRVGRGVLTGLGVGTAIGLAAGAMSLLTSNQILTAAIAMSAGSGLAVAVAVMMRPTSPS